MAIRRPVGGCGVRHDDVAVVVQHDGAGFSGAVQRGVCLLDGQTQVGDPGGRPVRLKDS